MGVSYSGILDFHTTLMTVDADKFEQLVEDALVPYLQPFNGVNAHSVVVLDRVVFSGDTLLRCSPLFFCASALGGKGLCSSGNLWHLQTGSL